MKDEVKEALFQLNPSKAPGPGGFLVVFPQKTLGLSIGQGVCSLPLFP